MARKFEMLSVSRNIETYTNGSNTIRVLSPKYENIRPGDYVHMSFAFPGKDDTRTEEFLTVRSVAIGDFWQILTQHWRRNHLVHRKSGSYTIGFIKKTLENFYPNIDVNTRLIAIYFN